MEQPKASMAQQIAQATETFERERTGHLPTSVTVVLRDDALVITTATTRSLGNDEARRASYFFGGLGSTGERPAGAPPVWGAHRAADIDDREMNRR